jgi:catechol 2,3-dioxygenase-like lactoylglutathione lyase family enzyme
MGRRGRRERSGDIASADARSLVPIVAIDHVQLAMPPGMEPAARDFYAGLLGIPEVAKPPRARPARRRVVPTLRHRFGAARPITDRIARRAEYVGDGVRSRIGLVGPTAAQVISQWPKK